MQVHTFTAESAADAVAQIRAQLGPQAVVLNVRPLPAQGLSRLWQPRKIEVLACLPEALPNSASPAIDTLAELRQELSQIRQRVEGRDATAPHRFDVYDTAAASGTAVPGKATAVEPALGRPSRLPDAGWNVAAFLENSGLLPIHAQRLAEELHLNQGGKSADSLGRELELAAGILRGYWKAGNGRSWNTGAHVLIGPPGVGKTVCLCKWLAQAVLVEERKASVWRLDGRVANTAEALSVYSEILATPVERFVPTQNDRSETDLLLIDLPGVNWTEAHALDHLAGQLRELPHPQVHLVLNAAYELPLLLAQARAFSALPVSGLIFTHLDEETRWGKIWNFVLGTNFSIHFLSAGQNVPGEWMPATAEPILLRQFPRK
jgi:flagellar biosynthesis protein FlhF